MSPCICTNYNPHGLNLRFILQTSGTNAIAALPVVIVVLHWLFSICFDVTKLYAFFSNGKWDLKDVDLIMDERLEGFEKLKLYYK